MATSKVTEDGRLTIPKSVLEQLGIGPGSEVGFRFAADGTVVIEKVAGVRVKPSRLKELRGDAGPGMTTDELMALTRGD